MMKYVFHASFWNELQHLNLSITAVASNVIKPPKATWVLTTQLVHRDADVESRSRDMIVCSITIMKYFGRQLKWNQRNGEALGESATSVLVKEH